MELKKSYHNFPERDGYYWVYITENNVKSLQFPINKYIVVKIHREGVNGPRRVLCFERLNIWNRTDSCSMKNFVTNTKFTEFIEIPNPNGL